MRKERDISLDVAKGLGIILVIWGHTTCPVFDEIYAFHMPFFFIVSGCFFKQRGSFKEVWGCNVKRLVYPYLLFSVLIYLFYLLFTATFHIEFDYLSILKIIPVKGAISTPLWFLVSLFTVSSLFYYIAKIKSIHLKVLVCLSLFFISELSVGPNYFYISTSLKYFIYYLLGYLVYKRYTLKHKGYGATWRLLLFLCLGVLLFLFLFNISWNFHRYLSIFVSLMVALTGAFVLILCSFLLAKCKMISRPIAYIGVNSLGIFAMQLPLMELARPISSLVFAKETYLWGGMNVFVNLGITIVVVLILKLLFPKILMR